MPQTDVQKHNKCFSTLNQRAGRLKEIPEQSAGQHNKFRYIYIQGTRGDVNYMLWLSQSVDLSKSILSITIIIIPSDEISYIKFEFIHPVAQSSTDLQNLHQRLKFFCWFMEAKHLKKFGTNSCVFAHLVRFFLAGMKTFS